MKLVNFLVIIIFLFGTLFPHAVQAQRVSRYRDFIMQATLAAETEDFPAALYYLKAAHFADRRQDEPFQLLQQLPTFNNFRRTVEHYYQMAVRYYKRGDFRNARFFFGAAHHLDPYRTELVDLLWHVDNVLAGRQSAREYIQELEAQTKTLAAVSDPIQVTPAQREKIKEGRYVVEHSAEVDAIIRKYGGPTAEDLQDRERKIEEALLEVARSQHDIDSIIKTQRIKEQARRVLTQSAQKSKRDRQSLPDADNFIPETVEDSNKVGKAEQSDSSVDDLFQKYRQTQVQTKSEPPLVTKKQPVKNLIPKVHKKNKRSADDRVISFKDTVILDDELWARQPGTILEIEFGQSIVLEGDRVIRYLLFDPEMGSVERQDEDRILLTMQRRGSTLFHVWDEKGRWTFNLKGVLPEPAVNLQQAETDKFEQHAAPFRVSYSNNWNSFYLGSSPDNLDRMNLSFTQWVGIYGDTPYGFVDASANYFRFPDTIKNTGRTVGLSNANLGPFEDFSIRGWDASKRFSELSLPGRFFRGVLFDSYLWDRQVQVSYLKGQDRAVFLQTSQGVTETRKSYIEGARFVLWPDNDRQFAFNYARGHGEERSSFLNDKVFSVEAKDKIAGIDAHLEVAYDESNLGTLLLTEYQNGDTTVRVNLRDYEDGFTTITSRPAGSGEIGANVIYEYRPENFQLSSNLDIYRDREQKNPDDANNVNIDWGTVYTQRLGNGYSWNSSFFLSKTPQLISPRFSARLNSTLSKTFQVFYERNLSTYLTVSAQLSRFDLSPTSDYDRYGVGVGLRIPIIDRLSFFINYDQSYVEVKEPKERSQPNVMNTGLSYSRSFGSKVSGRASITYRNEEDTDGRFSFLSGSDTIRSSVGFSYRPVPQVEIFLDGSLRNVLTESFDQPAFHDADVRFGMRADWDTFFRWDPTATVKGTVYKDLNRNDYQDAGEPGVEGVVVRLGNRTVTTGPRGTYRGKIRAKKVKVGLDFDSIPQGFSLKSYLMRDIDVKQGKTYTIDYGFMTRSGIYGVFFEDLNGNKLYDSGEPTVAKARMRLDGKEVAAADFEGVYQFYDVPPGDHTLTIDVNALPREFLPTIRLKSQISLVEGTTYTFHVPLRRQ